MLGKKLRNWEYVQEPPSRKINKNSTDQSLHFKWNKYFITNEKVKIHVASIRKTTPSDPQNPRSHTIKALSALLPKFLTCQPTQKQTKLSLLSIFFFISSYTKWKEDQFMSGNNISMKRRIKVSRKNRMSIRRIYRCVNVLIKRSSPFFLWSIHHKVHNTKSLSSTSFSI